jgi:hypothetical protein
MVDIILISDEVKIYQRKLSLLSTGSCCTSQQYKCLVAVSTSQQYSCLVAVSTSQQYCSLVDVSTSQQ